MSQRSLAPWHVEHTTLDGVDGDPSNVLVIGADGEVVADPRCGPGRTSAEIIANAYFIAAGPDLFAAIEALLDGLDDHWVTPAKGQAAVASAHAAIRKAKGKTHE